MGGLLSWLVVVLSCQLFLFSYRTLKASNGSFQWWRAFVDSGAWPFTDSSLEVRSILLEDVVANQHYLSEFNKERELEAANANLFYYQDDDNEVWADDQGDWVFEEHPYIDGALNDPIHMIPLPDLPNEETSFHSLNSDNSMLKHLDEMELKKTKLSTSGSGKRKAQGGDGDTASFDMVVSKKPKI